MGFVSETTIKSVRKARRCDGCSTLINVGQSAIRWAGVTDGDFGTAIYHPDCRAAEIALNKIIGGDYYDWWPLREIEHDDHEWLLSEYPVVAARMEITADKIREHREEMEACRRAWVTPASVDTRPKDEDATKIAASLASGAVGAEGDETPTPPHPSTPGEP